MSMLSSVDETASERYECEKCSYTTQSKNGLKIHNTKKHGNDAYKDKSTLEELYVEKGLSLGELGDRFNVGKHSIANALRNNDIEVRGAYEQARKERIPERVLNTLYHSQGYSLREIAELLNTNDDFVRLSMKHHDIDRRGRTDKAITKKERAECDQCGVCFDYWPSYQPGKVCSRECKHKWMSENLAGENSPRWKGGGVHYYGENWQEQRQKRLEKDGYKCRACGMSQEEHKEKYDTELEVHHLKPIRKFDDKTEANRIDNLVTACKPCHRKYEGLGVFPNMD